MTIATKLGVDFGRPIVTGIGVAEDAAGWFIRVDFHSFEDGDTHLILRSRAEAEEQVPAEVQRIAELNRAALQRERERMQAAALAQQEADAREAEIVDVVLKLHEGEGEGEQKE